MSENMLLDNGFLLSLSSTHLTTDEHTFLEMDCMLAVASLGDVIVSSIKRCLLHCPISKGGSKLI